MVLSLCLMPIVAIAIFGFTDSFATRQLKPLGRIAEFKLVDSNGIEVTREDYRKKVWIASFVFTHCDAQCPMIIDQMKKLQTKLYSKENIRLVSISIDPVRDSLEKLGQYATRVGARPNRWRFLTGTEAETKELVEKSFKLVGGTPAGEGDVTHSSYLVLVDGDGYIRGYYDAMDQKSMDVLAKDAKSLLRSLY